ncbi:MAG: apolipoprotein N-acyltransferase, partial [Planctomycetales bacterium]|nr:apolipoprotein N-acyltransferase [Planctomycetales bacterium]
LLRAALIQGSIDINVKADPAAQERIYQDHLRLSLEAVDRHDNLDLVIWPETMYRAPLILIDDDARLPEGTPGSVEIARQNGEVALQGLADLERAVGVPMLIGLDVIQVGDGVIDNFNSAVLVQVDGGLAARYDKMHPVMFGEYIPLGSTFPLLYELTAGALPRGIRAGERLEAFEVAGARLAVNICYETTVPHLLRRQVRAMGAAGAEPDVLVNLTNDGWFYGASELDLHLISGLFRAVELRKPLLIAANTGFSAWVDGGGRLRAQGGRRVEDIVLAEPRRCELTSWYTRWGDTPAGLCLAACAALVIVAVRDRRRYRTVQ